MAETQLAQAQGPSWASLMFQWIAQGIIQFIFYYLQRQLQRLHTVGEETNPFLLQTPCLKPQSEHKKLSV